MSQNKYWRGIEEKQQTEQFVKQSAKEFAEDLPMLDAIAAEKALPSNRRNFLKMLGFGITSATLAASCTQPVRKAIPYTIKPEEITPGVASYYASTFWDGLEYASILVKTRDGRPIKLEGNKSAELTNGGTSIKAQASILSLYDTNRLDAPRKINGDSINKETWANIDEEITAKLKANPSGNYVLVSSTIISPSTKALIKSMQAKFPNFKHVTYDSNSASGMLEANKESFGKAMIPKYHFDKAEVIVGLDADFLGTWISPVEFIAQYAKGRRVSEKKPKMSRHFQIEARMSLTGCNADVRVPVKYSEIGAAALALLKKLGGSDANVPPFDGSEQITKIAKELKAAKGKALVVCGSNDKNIQLVVNAINNEIGAYGTTIDTGTACNLRQGLDSDFTSLVNGGKTDAIFVHNCNPVYDSIMGDKFAKLLAQSDLAVSFNQTLDATARACNYACPTSHFLESWGDAEPYTGMISLQQPSITTIFDTRQFQDSLMVWSGMNKGMSISYPKPAEVDSTTNANGELEIAVNDGGVELNSNPKDYQSYLTAFYKGKLSGKSWTKALHDGVATMASAPSAAATFTASNINQGVVAMLNVGQRANGPELELFEDTKIGNGMYADNPWCQETPDPVTKTTYGNYVMVSPRWAMDNGVKDGDVLKVSANGYSVDVPACVQPGQKMNTFAIPLGYGRKFGGRASRDIRTSWGTTAKDMGRALGVDVNPFKSRLILSGVSIEKTGLNENLAQTQTHHSINITQPVNLKPGEESHDEKYRLKDRTVIREMVLDNLKDDIHDLHEERHFYQHMIEDYSIYKGHEQEYSQGHHWGLGIDLNSCVGCGACVTSCHIENNVPVVGKVEVERVHEMHWLRIDRYYSGNEENPQVVFQPVMCQHCDNAPCENVCPVSATNHSSEGLNQMAYNRCIGTRYCANNCPFKVRRFNWYDYWGADSFPWNEHKGNSVNTELGRLVLNPDVTVRSRGVMEKCSMCVQRVQLGKLEAKKRGEKLKDGDIKTACQTACPSDAIVFGDMNDKKSEVSKYKKSGRNYVMLEEINVASSVNYLAKVRNLKKDEIV